ncbi:MAG: FAD synthetase family protein [Bacillota bacterium]
MGHQQVIKEAKNVAEEQELPLAIMSFFPHPKEVLSNGKRIVPYLMPMEDKRKFFKELGADCFYLIEFNQEFARLSPRDFVQTYLLDIGAKQVVAGFDFTYGYLGKGNMDTLYRDSNGKIRGIKIEKIAREGEKISSTLIRNLVMSGEVERVPSYLGKDYQMEGSAFFRKNHVELVLHPYYLLPAPGLYEVTIKQNPYQELTMLIAFVRDGMLTLYSPNGKEFPFFEWDTVRLAWKKRLPNGFIQVVDSRQGLVHPSFVHL